MIALIDYGMGNLRSVQKALEAAGADDVLITQDAETIQSADRVVLPGVGAIAPAMKKLSDLNLISVIKDVIAEGKPFLGICLGFQLLFEKSFEFGEIEGLGIIKGTVQKFDDTLKVPQMGWNSLKLKECILWRDVEDGTDVYFCHSYYVKPNAADVIAATTDYGIEFCSAVTKDNVFGTQFHPEKSQTAGLQILKNFLHVPLGNMGSGELENNL